ncbi:MAG: hypothetical protein D4R65_10075 [Verrucomicrobiaceae bacterium]|nr:MAG: hypothetical protein D4R65_10075 [Verrucomicrobiaceae bacterium]
MNSLLNMQVKKGDPVLAEHWNSLLDWLRATQIIGGDNVLVSRTPNGTFVRALPTASAPGAAAWRVSLGASDAEQTATISRGLIEGVEPTIKDKKIGGDPINPDVPAPALPLPKPGAAEGFLYIKATLSKEIWRIEKAEITFEEKAPSAKEWTAYKLLAILRKSGEAWQLAHQAIHFNLGLYSYGRKPSGKARHLFFAR